MLLWREEYFRKDIFVMKTIGFIGFGLIGGSIAKSIRSSHPEYHLAAYSRTRSSLEKALNEHTIDQIWDHIDNKFSCCDYIFLCTPVTCNANYLKELKPLVKKGCIITDVGSTKENIHDTVSSLSMEECFIGGHPMAGSERTGYEASSGLLLENAYYVITPTSQNKPEDIEQLKALVSDMGAIPLILNPKQHDQVVAAISHLPHIIASALVNLVRDSDTKDEIMKQVAAGGFKDITRIASSSPVMWEQICMENRTNLTQILKKYITSLNGILKDLEDADHSAIHNLFEESGEYRNSLQDHRSGALPKEYSIYCDIIDQAGAIATIATTLSVHQLNIKNIGIIHNREFEEGVLKIEFYDENSCKKASEILSSCHYQVYQRS